MIKWKPIKTAPIWDEGYSFLVLMEGNMACDKLILQVQPFQGSLYPDHLDFLIDWEDRIENATHWAPLPKMPK